MASFVLIVTMLVESSILAMNFVFYVLIGWFQRITYDASKSDRKRQLCLQSCAMCESILEHVDKGNSSIPWTVWYIHCMFDQLIFTQTSIFPSSHGVSSKIIHTVLHKIDESIFYARPSNTEMDQIDVKKTLACNLYRTFYILPFFRRTGIGKLGQQHTHTHTLWIPLYLWVRACQTEAVF